MIQNILCLAALLVLSFIATAITSAFRAQGRSFDVWWDSEGILVMLCWFIAGFAVAAHFQLVEAI